MRPLSPEEAALWARVTASITPLSREAAATKSQPQPAPEPQAKPVQSPAKPKGRVPPPRPVTSAPVRRATIHGNLDSHWERRLKNGNFAVDRTLDLHGMNLTQAYEALDLALERAIAAGDRLLLLVTGHHRPGEPPVQRGKIRAAVHDWLAVSRHAERIAAVRSAHRRHGGGGSLYLILRR
ncbi:Smr/MutS family protein [Sphingomonas sp. LHG3406-1]|uniref:Smr/MutS family protein n=1 Tax=Sphingomonas sp. LHG3406-1 TaxID=2804617 RepID=UPI0026395642|nr:Smr/MutS family protein [Sphingomonas sp. LHG3406-1]